MTAFWLAWLAWCGFAALAAVIGGLLHEATHAAAARLLGGRVIDVGRDGWALYVDWESTPGMTTLDVRLVQLAPALFGWSVAAVWLARNGWPNLSPATIVSILGWAIYTVGGGLEDYSFARSTAAYQDRDAARQEGGD